MKYLYVYYVSYSYTDLMMNKYIIEYMAAFPLQMFK